MLPKLSTVFPAGSYHTHTHTHTKKKQTGQRIPSLHPMLYTTKNPTENVHHYTTKWHSHTSSSRAHSCPGRAPHLAGPRRHGGTGSPLRLFLSRRPSSRRGSSGCWSRRSRCVLRGIYLSFLCHPAASPRAAIESLPIATALDIHSGTHSFRHVWLTRDPEDRLAPRR
jgi:hypothetical protein